MKQIVLCSALILSLSACSWLPFKNQSVQASGDSQVITSDFTRSKLIAQDLANAMAQIPQLDPSITSLYTARPPSRFGELLLIALQNSGFDLRMGAPESPNWLIYNVSKEVTPSVSGNTVYTFLVSAGNVKLKRSYEVDGLGVAPTSTLFVLGADASKIELDDTLFSPRNKIKQVPDKQTDTAAEAMMVRVEPVPLQDSFVPKPLPSTALEINANKVKLNMYETRQSNFAEELAEYETVRREIMIFPNDSLVMGSRNKQLARNLLTDFDASSDVISLIGCSHGKTNLDNGNEVLAVGRAARVKEEFVLAGIEARKLLDEGCWANVHFDEKMPRRGVVVTHKRLIN